MASYVPLVFLCHASSDVDRARELAAACGQDGRLRFWMSEDDVKLGQNYATAIWEAIRSSDALLVLLSEQALVSEHVRREVGIAIDSNRPVLPVLLSANLLASPRMSGEWQYWLHTTQAVVWTGAEATADVILRRFEDQRGTPPGMPPSHDRTPVRVTAGADAPRRRLGALAIVAVVCVAVGVAGSFLAGVGRPSGAGTSASVTSASATASGGLRSQEAGRGGAGTLVGRFTGTAAQASQNSKLWEVDLTLGETSGTITYGRDGVRGVCAGTVTLQANGRWTEHITTGSCTQNGSWAFTATTDTTLEGRYEPPSGVYVVVASLQVSD